MAAHISNISPPDDFCPLPALLQWNELHHLQIMESLGGDQLWIDRFMAFHAAIVYYFILVLLFIVSPKLAYNFSELIEAHAVDTVSVGTDSCLRAFHRGAPW